MSHCTGLTHSHETQERGGSPRMTDNLLSSLHASEFPAHFECELWGGGGVDVQPGNIIEVSIC